MSAGCMNARTQGCIGSLTNLLDRVCYPAIADETPVSWLRRAAVRYQISPHDIFRGRIHPHHHQHPRCQHPDPAPR